MMDAHEMHTRITKYVVIGVVLVTGIIASAYFSENYWSCKAKIAEHQFAAEVEQAKAVEEQAKATGARALTEKAMFDSLGRR